MIKIFSKKGFQKKWYYGTFWSFFEKSLIPYGFQRYHFFEKVVPPI